MSVNGHANEHGREQCEDVCLHEHDDHFEHRNGRRCRDGEEPDADAGARTERRAE